MARQFKEVWRALDISFDDFIQTSEPRHHAGCQKFIQKVYDNGYIYKGSYEGWYCEGCEAFKTENGGQGGRRRLPDPQDAADPRAASRAISSRCRSSRISCSSSTRRIPISFSRRAGATRSCSSCRAELQDVNITRTGETWGIQVPFDPEFTIYVWFDALLNYITAIGYGADDERFSKWWPADMHFIGKDITRFHCALWPAMCFAAGIEPPTLVFGHGFVYIKKETTGDAEKISKSLGNVVEPMEIITKFSSDAFRYYFMRECPFPGDGEFSWERFAEVYNADLANNLGNLLQPGGDADRARTTTAYLHGHGRPNAGGDRTPRSAETTVAAGAAAHRGVPVQPGAGEDLAADPRPGQPVRRQERAVEAGQDRQGRGQGRCCSTWCEQLRARGDPAQAVSAALGGDDLSQLQLRAAVGAGALRRRRPRPAVTVRSLARLDKGKVKPLFPVIS